MQISDIHIKEEKPELSIIYEKSGGNPRKLTEGDVPFVLGFHELLKGAVRREDFTVEYSGESWRCCYDQQTVDGNWYRLRRSDAVVDLDNLPSPMPAPIRDMLLSPALSRGGLVLVCGPAGSGKTTTGTAIVVSRLMKHGGVATTVEEPVEKAMNGWHGEGYCTQTEVGGESGADWAKAMRRVLRSQPAGSNVMLYVGEVRDADSARMMLRAASNGFLVITTSFGDNIINGIDTFFQLLGRDFAPTLAAVTRAIVHQKLEANRFLVQVLTSESPSSEVANMIRSGQLPQLQTEINYQRNQLMAGLPLFPAQK